MKTYTICYAGTDNYFNQGLDKNLPEVQESYNSYSGYIPSKINNLLSLQVSKNKISTALNGCGEPYQKTRKSLPVRVWSLDSKTQQTQCEYAPSIVGDAGLGSSMDIIAIAGIAKMLGVTLHIVPTGEFKQIKNNWAPQNTMGYTQADLAFPKDKGSTTQQATMGGNDLRWNEEDDNTITKFLTNFNQVVLLGHSRGGVSCIIAANYLAEWFNSLAIKIIALDPVPGTGPWWNCLSHVPATPNMEYIGIYAIDETSEGFNGVVPRVKGITNTKDKEIAIWDPLNPASTSPNFENWNYSNYRLLYTRGRHATVPGSRTSFGRDEDPIDNNVGASGNLVNAYVIKKLNEWNVNLPPCHATDINGWINDMNSISDHFKEMRNYTYSTDKLFGGAIGGAIGGVIGGTAGAGLGVAIGTLVNQVAYFHARGISSTAGINPSAWNYLEAFIQYQKITDTVTQQEADKINKQRGLVNIGVRDKYYDEFAGSSKGQIHPWHFITSVFKI